MNRIFTLLITFAFGFSALMAENVSNDIGNVSTIHISEGTRIVGADFLFVKKSDKKHQQGQFLYIADDAVIIGRENIFVKGHSINIDTTNTVNITQVSTPKAPSPLVKRVKTHTKRNKNTSKILYNGYPFIPINCIMVAANGTKAIVPPNNRLEHNALKVDLFSSTYYLFYFIKPTSKERTNFYIAEVSSNFGIRPPPFEV